MKYALTSYFANRSGSHTREHCVVRAVLYQ
jgi:hypothetical protein